MLEKNQTPQIGLTPRLGLFTAIMMVMGSIIGSGIFKKIAPMTLKLQSQNLVMICWIVAGLITLFGALTYAEIASRIAQTGGLYAYLRAIYGKRTAYFFGWSCFAVIQSASIASIAYVFAEATIRVIPFSFYGLEIQALAIATIIILTTINYLGLLFGAVVENLFTVLKILGLLIIIVLSLMYNATSLPVNSFDSSLIYSPTGFNVIPLMFSAMLGAFWAFDGLNNVGFIGGEVQNARRNVPIALTVGVVGVLAIYLITNFAFFHALPVNEIIPMAMKSGSIFAIEMINQISGTSWALFVSILIMVSTLGATNGSILTSSRIYYAMADDGVFFRPFKKIHPKFQTPSFALVAQAIWASVLVLWGTFDQLTDMLIVASFIFYGLGAYGIFILRKQKNSVQSGPANSNFRVPSIIPIIYSVFCVILIIVMTFQTPVETGTGFLLILLGLPIYMWIRQD